MNVTFDVPQPARALSHKLCALLSELLNYCLIDVLHVGQPAVQQLIQAAHVELISDCTAVMLYLQLAALMLYVTVHVCLWL